MTKREYKKSTNQMAKGEYRKFGLHMIHIYAFSQTPCEQEISTDFDHISQITNFDTNP